eukprot:2605760-Pyramimonas_sp.AAC.1
MRYARHATQSKGEHEEDETMEVGKGMTRKTTTRTTRMIDEADNAKCDEYVVDEDGGGDDGHRGEPLGGNSMRGTPD